ncbi:hypothetical protein [Nonomuraea rubra]|uniref:Uncharacterized protein n=1 Tax=Nonomuraea rubra TaxID=46180 RepID=A0A7X0U0Y8_9ACTN|nr:hypothetical protein [Nonomuraea rubra]MBB6551116.1 hypothetical protein [Nonomuraea rubra]
MPAGGGVAADDGASGYGRREPVGERLDRAAGNARRDQGFAGGHAAAGVRTPPRARPCTPGPGRGPGRVRRDLAAGPAVRRGPAADAADPAAYSRDYAV